MCPDRVSNAGPLTYESGALPIAYAARLQVLAVDLKFCIAITGILKMSTCYFEEKWGRE